IDWGQLGPDGTNINGPVAVTSAGGINAVASLAAYPGQRLEQSTTWFGNFTPADHLLYSGNLTVGGSAPTTLDFGSVALTQVGAQIQQDFFGDFTATIEAFDSLGNSLGTVTENGTSNGDADGSAIYIGVMSTDNNISKIVFSAVSLDANDFAINTVSLTPASVPEP